MTNNQQQNESISTTNVHNASIHSDITYLNQFKSTNNNNSSSSKIYIDGSLFGKSSHNVSVSNNNNNNNASP